MSRPSDMPTRLSRVQVLVDKYSSSLGLPFQQLLPESFIAEALDEEKIKYRQRIFSPIVTIWAFLSQVIDTDYSCHNAVSRIISWLAGAGLEIPSEDNSAYCQARKRLLPRLLQKLFIKVGNKLESKTTPEHTWCGRHVKVLDGSTVSMSDTNENQKAYPQPGSQKAGCGFPLAKIMVLFSITTGAAIGYVHLLAYNLLRTVMWQAVRQKGVNPLRISLQGTRQHLNNFISELKDASPINRERLYQPLAQTNCS